MSSIENRLGNQSEVTDQNIMDYLSAIEETANDLVKRHIVMADTEDDPIARATVYRQNEETGGAPAPEDAQNTQEKVFDWLKVAKNLSFQHQILQFHVLLGLHKSLLLNFEPRALLHSV